MTQFAVLAAPGSRVQGFDAALRAAGLPAARTVSYAEFLRDPERLSRALDGADALRVDSPGGDFEAWRQFASFAEYDASELSDDKGRIDPPRPFYAGFMRALSLASERASACGGVQLCDAAAVGLLYDKVRCHALMRSTGLPVPDALARVAGFDGLETAMRSSGFSRVFVKLRYGSGASGVAAVELQGSRVRAWSTAEFGPGDALYNSRAIRRHLDGDARRLIDCLAAMDVHCERWIPKLKIDGLECDLRLLVIGGEPAHAVVRLSPSPITNLHIGNKRASADVLRAQVPADTWRRILAVGRAAGALFPGQYCVALDIAVHADREQVFVLEGNAFGDYLRGVTHEGLDPYAWQIAKFPAWRTRAAA